MGSSFMRVGVIWGWGDGGGREGVSRRVSRDSLMCDCEGIGLRTGKGYCHLI